MSLFKCKMCGGTIEFEQGATVGTCDSCGTKQTLPHLDDNKKANMYDRANHFRRNNDFDKAIGIYEQILNDDNTDSETYWSLVLCRYGIEYVEDFTTHKRVPTVNRAQFTSIFMDEDYKSAIQYADAEQRKIYESEAKIIDNIQKGILEVSSKEEPFDIFICYKETDDNGRRTRDSVLANELYNELTQKGFKVFYSRITLEDKLGQEYEPYIFAALNSAKVMIVIGTKPEYFNAAWVKNEWNRFLALIKGGANKTLIPAYRDMDPYDLPEEFSNLQAQDMSKLGFLQDLIRGVMRIIDSDVIDNRITKSTSVISDRTNINSLLSRAFVFLENGEWNKADMCCDVILDIDSTCARAYLGKLMVELRVNRPEKLSECKNTFDDKYNFQKAIIYGDNNLKNELEGYILKIQKQIKDEYLYQLYSDAIHEMNSADTYHSYLYASEKFDKIKDYRDSNELSKICLEKAEEFRKNSIYNSAIAAMNSSPDKKTAFENAINIWNSIRGWKDTDDRIERCKRLIEEIEVTEEKEKIEHKKAEEQQRIAAEQALLKRKRTIYILIPVLIITIAIIIIIITNINPFHQFKS